MSDEERGALLAAASAVVYTPSLEHFGIVPLEAMAAGRPVVAVDDGGPKETVKHGASGRLCAAELQSGRRSFARRRDRSPRRMTSGGCGGWARRRARSPTKSFAARRIAATKLAGDVLAAVARAPSNEERGHYPRVN